MKITQNAISSIEWLFQKSICDNSLAGQADRCVVTILADSAPIVGNTKRHLVLLNIASHEFRIVTMFHFGTDDATAAYFSAASRGSNKKLGEQILLDAYSELVNMICGGVNRGLRGEFRHIALSTPFVLEASCSKHVSALNCSMTRSIKVVINDSVSFDVIVGVSVAKGTTLDFKIDRMEQERTACGEMELF